MTTTRFGGALAASIALHLAVILPADGWLPRQPAPLPPLSVRLPPTELAHALATQPEIPDRPPAAVPPPPTLRSGEKPRELEGRAFDTALAALAREEFYPREAIERGLEGRVVLLLTLAADGRVTGIEVASGSGHPILDAAALRAAARIASLPGGRRQALLPVEFRLE
ncbi:MAG: TonB family protein [Sulfuritalea sp.]|nr:TonB family protein [Sulfuritalea sp.]